MRERVTEKDMGTRGRADAGQRGRGGRRRADAQTRGRGAGEKEDARTRGRGDKESSRSRGEELTHPETISPPHLGTSAPGHLYTEHLLTPHFLTSLTPHSSLTEAIDEVDSQADKVGDAQFVEL